MSDVIKSLTAIEVLSGAGRPTVEVQLCTERGIKVSASVPSGTSKGKYEACEVYDGGRRFGGKGVKKAVENVNSIIAPEIVGKGLLPPRVMDRVLLELDGTSNKSHLGGNAVLAVSLAVAKAGAEAAGLPLYSYLGGVGAKSLPMPIATVIAGGKHSPSALDFEDYILVFHGFTKFSDALEALVEIRRKLGETLEQKCGNVPDVGGALSPNLSGSDQAFEIMLEVVEKAGYAGKVGLGLDVAGSDLYLAETGLYRLAGKEMTVDEALEYYINLAKKYPLVFLEDPFDQDDFTSFARLTAALPQVQIVGDDLFVSNAERLKEGLQHKAANTLLLKVNQIGTVTEAVDAGLMAIHNNYDVTVSLRSSDTNDDFIADLAVGLGAKQIKLGSPVRGERNAKYNRLLKIEQELEKEALFGGLRLHK